MEQKENSLKVQWLTTDKTLFELDWLTYLLNQNPDNIVSNPRQLNVYPKTILIVNRHLNYRETLDLIRYKQYKYGIILLSDENLTEPLEFLHDPSCLFLARNYIHPNYINHPKVFTFGLGYKTGFSKLTQGTKNLNNRELLWSFAGTLHSDRPEMLELFKNMGPHKTHACSGFGATDALDTAEYAELLKNSMFALCPPGQDSTDTFRIYEALEANCIPVTLNNTNHSNSNRMRWKLLPSYWSAVFRKEELPFIHADTWEEASDLMIKAVQDNKISELQAECSALWKETKKEWRSRFSELLTM